MSAHGAGAPLGDQARDTTAPPWTGRHRARYVCDACGFPAIHTGNGWQHAEAADAAFCGFVFAASRLPAPDEDAPFYAGGMSRREERLADRADDPYQPDHQETPR